MNTGDDHHDYWHYCILSYRCWLCTELSTIHEQQAQTQMEHERGLHLCNRPINMALPHLTSPMMFLPIV